MVNPASPIDIEVAPAQSSQVDVYAMTAGMIWQDRLLLPPLMLLLLAPQLLVIYFGTLGPSHAGLVLITQRLVELLFLYFITKRWLRRLSIGEPAIVDIHLVRYLLLGFAVWICMMAPLIMQVGTPSQELQIPFLLILVPTIVLWLRYYFLFFPIITGIPSFKNCLVFARSLLASDSRIPFYTIAAPLGIAGLLYGLAYIPAPDGRIIVLDYFGALAAELYWPLSCYLSLAFCFAKLDDRTWHELSLDPYREARFTTLAMQSFSPLALFLKPKNGVKLLVIATMLWFGNKLQLETTPPAPSITVLESNAREDRATIKLRLTDQQYHFRGFQPLHFVLAGEQRHLVSDSIEAIHSDAGDDTLLYQIPPTRDEIVVEITFKTNRSGEGLTSLEDLYLWYRAVKLEKISLRQVENEPQKAP